MPPALSARRTHRLPKIAAAAALALLPATASFAGSISDAKLYFDALSQRLSGEKKSLALPDFTVVHGQVTTAYTACVLTGLTNLKLKGDPLPAGIRNNVVMIGAHMAWAPSVTCTVTRPTGSSGAVWTGTSTTAFNTVFMVEASGPSQMYPGKLVTFLEGSTATASSTVSGVSGPAQTATVKDQIKADLNTRFSSQLPQVAVTDLRPLVDNTMRAIPLPRP